MFSCLITHFPWAHGQGFNTNPLRPEYEDYAILNQIVANFEQVFDSTPPKSGKTPELGASFDKANAIAS